MNQLGQTPARLASEDVIINAPLSYSGSAQRIMRLRRRAHSEPTPAWLTALAVLIVVIAWLFVTAWYLVWGFWLVPYRLLRRGARKRKAEALRHRELLAAIQTGPSAQAVVPAPPPPPTQRIGDAEREQTIEELRAHMLAGRLSSEEFEQRVGAVHQARTRGEIMALSGDLPTGTTGSNPCEQPARQ